ncbi:MAG: hypothetical protein Faunusvirus15_13 [Faunusvirus sp.]|jgi:hypothetical protein|uniref:Ankyrin repeat protein n=1 Tax=Faunusvirus sp. TaxID=2487766 RepID=A0A3G4ZX16_9VIRU|nr:MAG: hypothetical protein Faunusvirus15_13 [Faunusvirus sp.]
MDVLFDGFRKLARQNDEIGCLKYIDKHDNFRNIIYDDTSILQYACDWRLKQVAFGLINRNCDLVFQDKRIHMTAMCHASNSGLISVVAYIIDKLPDTKTRYLFSGTSEMMYLCNNNRNVNNILKMIKLGYDIYYKLDRHIYNTRTDKSLLTAAIDAKLEPIVKKLLDINNNFIAEFNAYYDVRSLKKDEFHDNIVNYYTKILYRQAIITEMNDVSATNMLYQSFRKIYAVDLVNIICDFII